jgi:hypothetical protein
LQSSVLSASGWYSKKRYLWAGPRSFHSAEIPDE